MSGFIKGLTLCEDFFFEIAKSLLNAYFPDLRYTSELLG